MPSKQSVFIAWNFPNKFSGDRLAIGMVGAPTLAEKAEQATARGA